MADAKNPFGYFNSSPEVIRRGDDIGAVSAVASQRRGAESLASIAICS
jgi:hypothetical protein